VARGSAVAGFALGALLLVGCAASSSPNAPAASPQRANPASQNCVAKGGMLSIEKTGSGGEYGVCRFADNRQCEEWAMLRGECPVGGLRVTGHVTPAARYCAITGGQYAVTGASNTADEQGTCAFPNGVRCDARTYYDGTCSRN
jgi:putative hemolysin